MRSILRHDLLRLRILSFNQGHDSFRETRLDFSGATSSVIVTQSELKQCIKSSTSEHWLRSQVSNIAQNLSAVVSVMILLSALIGTGLGSGGTLSSKKHTAMVAQMDILYTHIFNMQA